MILLVVLTNLLQMAGVDTANHACGQNEHSQKLASLIMGHQSQQRVVLECNELLAEIAARRAVDLVGDPKPNGLTPNEILIKNGYRFASFYPPSGNQVEAVAADVETPESALDYLIRSYKHRDLVLGDGEFFSRQSQIGVGFYKNEHNETQYVVLIAEPYASPRVVIEQEFEAPTTSIEAECVRTWRFSQNQELRKLCRERWQEKKNGN